MDLYFTKKQILSLSEQDATADPAAQAPTAGTSDKQAGGQGYPEVGKWESGIERGPANQVGVTKWADVVGSKLKRGKANQLKEQEGRGTAIALNPEEDKKRVEEKNKQNQLKQDFNKNFLTFKTPATRQVKGGKDLPIPRNFNNEKTTFSLWKHPIKYGSFYSNLINTQYDNYVPTSKMLDDILPDGTLRSFTVGGVQYKSTLIRTSENPIQYQFYWYLDKDGKSYSWDTYDTNKEVPLEYLYDGSLWSVYGQGTFTVLSIIAAALIPGTQGLLISIGLDLIVSADLYFRENDSVGALVQMVLAFIPVIGNQIGVLKITAKDAQRLLPEFKGLETASEIDAKIKTLSSYDQGLMKGLLSADPKIFEKPITTYVGKNSMNVIKNQKDALEVVNHINWLVHDMKALNVRGAKWWVQTLGLQRFGFDVAVSGVIVYGGMKYKEKNSIVDPNLPVLKTRHLKPEEISQKEIDDFDSIKK